MKYPPHLLDDIRARLPVSQVVSRSVALKKSGREWKGLSPFKSEKTPSFFVNDQKGFYHCFASGSHGDIFRFIMETEGLTFPEAIEKLAAEAGVPLPKFEPRSPVVALRRQREDESRTRLYALLAAAQAFFEAQLHAPAGAVARLYVQQKRGLGRETIATFGIGYAPAGRSALKDHLTRLGFEPDEMVASGMLIGGEDIPVPYDRFRNRVMFPIADTKGRVIAFGGRALEADVPAKYLNSPETPLFHKGSVLFNAARARPPAHKTGRVIVVEGYMDVVALTQAGFGDAVAPLGTALTEDQARLLWRMAEEPILCFDGDAAGQKAAARAIETVMPHLQPGISVRFAFLPNGLDPDDLIRQNGAAAMTACLERTRSLVDMLWDREWAGGDWTTPERRAQLEKRLADLIARIADPSVRGQYQKDIRNRLYEAWTSQRRKTAPSQASSAHKGQFSTAGNRFVGQKSRFGQPLSAQQLRLPASPSLRQSRLGTTGPAAGPPQREALLVLTLLNHPWLIEQRCEEIAALEFTHAPFMVLKAALLDITAQNVDSGSQSLDSAQLHTHLTEIGLDSIASQVSRAVTHSGDKFAIVGADPGLVVLGWSHAIALHQTHVVLARAMEVAQSAWQSDQSNENAERITELNALRSLRLDFEQG